MVRIELTALRFRGAWSTNDVHPDIITFVSVRMAGFEPAVSQFQTERIKPLSHILILLQSERGISLPTS